MKGSLKSNMIKVLNCLQEMTDEVREDTDEASAKFNELIEKRMNDGVGLFRELCEMQEDIERRTEFQEKIMNVVREFMEEYFAS